MAILEVQHLHKRYEKFHLNDVSFSLERGYIMGFIGINGAGKTTTLKSMLNMVHADSGTVRLLDRDFSEHEVALKQELGIMLGDMNLYVKKRVSLITAVVRRFYDNWDDEIYADYCRKFSIDQDKRLSELSQGMRTKYFLTLALSHHARLFILDEPTTGLDPAARDDLLEIFQKLVEDGEKSVLFSTHITSDLEKCADYITYIHQGQIIGSAEKDEFLDTYRVVKGGKEALTEQLQGKLISLRNHSFGFSGLLRSADRQLCGDLQLERPTLDDIMIYYAKKGSTL